MTEPLYKIQILGRGEQMIYSDSDVELMLERTWCDGHRIFCDSTSGSLDGLSLPFHKRKQIIENLCDHFKSDQDSIIFVIDIADSDCHELESLFVHLQSKGHKITVEHDSEQMREQYHDQAIIDLLDAGKTVSIDGVEFRTAEDYRKWKQDA